MKRNNMISTILLAGMLVLLNFQGCDGSGEEPDPGPGPGPGKTYSRETVNGFSFEVSSEFDWNKESNNAYRYAGKSLDDLVTVLPPGILSRMRGVTFRVEKAVSEGDILEYDGEEDVLIFSDMGRYYAASKLNRPSLLLHMLARRYYLVHGSQNESLVEEAYSAAMGSGIYSTVDYYDGSTTLKKQADATRDAETYFAELTEAYWGKNDFYPFDYHDLMEYDPEGFRLMETVWGVRGSNGFLMKNYDRYRIQGYDVMIPREASGYPQLDEALTLLDTKLADINRLVDKQFSDFFKRRKIWCEVDSGSTTGGAAEHHPSRDWLRNNGRYVEKYNCVEISNLGNFLLWCGANQPLMILHELAHAYHFSFSDAYINQVNVVAAYNNAVNSGLYTNVDYIGIDGQVTKREKAYALNNEKEFFAENSEAYFDGNEFYPHNRTQLKEYDRFTWELMENVWKGENFKE